ncbi:MAG: hypothetical protein IJ243_04200 [Prevotella sp.]|nr:hypothetical protein [Prevotella sp.]
MKKTAYIAPATTVTEVELHLMVDASISSVGGNSGLEKGNGPTPDSADSRGGSLWDDEDDEW